MLKNSLKDLVDNFTLAIHSNEYEFHKKTLTLAEHKQYIINAKKRLVKDVKEIMKAIVEDLKIEFKSPYPPLSTAPRPDNERVHNFKQIEEVLKKIEEM